MDRRRKERLEARRRAGLTREQRLRETWRETGDLDAAEELTRLLADEPAPRCEDCGAPLDKDRFDEENPERLGELDLLKYGPGPVCSRCWDARERLRRVEEDDSPDLAYVYAAALYCAPCGLDVRRRLEREGKAPKPSEVLDERSYDSDDYPKGPVPRGGGESDSPELCASGAECLRALELEDGRHGAWLGNDLTSEGLEWLREALLERPTPLVMFWARSYDVDLPGELAPQPFSCDRCGREEQRWYGEHSCGECDERFCVRCEDEGGSAHGGYHDCTASGNPGDRRRRLERRAARGDPAATARLAEGRLGSKRSGQGRREYRGKFVWRQAPGYRELVWVKPGTREELRVGRAFAPGGGGVMFSVLDDRGPLPHVADFAEAKEAIINEVVRRLRRRRATDG